MPRRLIPAALAAAVTLILAHLGASQALGAHPFWDTKIAWIGAPIGALLGLVLPRKTRTILGLALLTAAALGLAHYGKTQFAASYAEDRLAGQFWYFGWIATAALFTATLATLARR